MKGTLGHANTTVQPSSADSQHQQENPATNLVGLETNSAQSGEKQAAIAPPNGGYGWVCVFCCFWINAHTWGINSSYGVFLAYYLDNNYYPGALPLEFAFVGGLSISMALFISPLATTTTRLYGTNVTLLIGVFFETLALIGASFSREIWQLFLSQGLCFGWGMGFLFVGSVRRRSLYRERFLLTASRLVLYLNGSHLREASRTG